MRKNLHPNYIKSSNLIFVSAGLGIINMFSLNIDNNTSEIFEEIFIIGFLFGFGILVRIGISWFKYIFLALFLISILAIPFTIEYYWINSTIGIVNIVQTVLQIWALVILFQKSKVNIRRTNGS